MSSWNQPQGIERPRPSMQRAPFVSDESVFSFDSELPTSVGTQFSPGSLMSGREEPQMHFGSLMSIDEIPHIASHPPLYNQLQQRAPAETQPGSFQFPSVAPSNAAANNTPSLLSFHFKKQAPAYGHAPLSPMSHFMSSSSNTNEQGQHPPLKFDEDWEFQHLFSGPEITSSVSDWSLDRGQTHATVDKGQAHTAPIGTSSTNELQRRGASFFHPYPSPSYGGAGDSINSSGASFMDNLVEQFALHQQQAVLSIHNYIQSHPNAAIPASLITSELAEVQDGRGWCLLGNCGVERAMQKLNRDYDIRKDTARKRLDHLYDHIRDKHFNYRPFRCAIPPCTQTFSREHDVKRHEKTHMAVSLPCDVCGKHYTHKDNLKRHVQLKHWSLSQTSRRSSGA